jgi:phage-related protein (TIGR01555 family)
LIDMISEDATTTSNTLQNRMAVVDAARSVARALVIDAEGEDFQYVPRNAAGIDKLLEMTWLRLAAAARMPVTRLMGQSPSGMNATGASDLRFWYDTVRASQRHELKPRLERIVNLAAKNVEGVDPGVWEVNFPSLWQMSEKEEAEVKKIVAETDKIYTDSGVVLPEEVTISRWGSGAYSSEMDLDLEARHAVLEAELDRLEKEAKEPPPEPPVPPVPPDQLPVPPPDPNQEEEEPPTDEEEEED